MPTTPESEIEWEEPPPLNEERGKYEDFFDELRERPWKWAKSPHPSMTAGNVRAGSYKGAACGEFEASQRFLAHVGETRVWVRYVGVPPTDPADRKALP